MLVEKLLLGLVSVGLIWAAAYDWRTRQVPFAIGVGMLAAGLAFLLLRGQWLAATFYLSAVWGSRGGLWRLPIIILAIVLVANQGFASAPLVIGILYVLSIFSLGWFGGGDAQIAIGLVALAEDWWILAYIFGGTILLALFLLVRNRGSTGALKRMGQILSSLHSADDEAISVPWAVLAATGGLIYIWVWPGGFWH
jgi:Flp pilus assembly protein protease CpaA